MFFIIGFARPLIYLRGQEGYIDNLTGIVFKAEEKYYLVITLKGNYYIPLENYEIGDIVKISGTSSRALFSHYENSFDFSKYLNNRFVYYKIEDCNSTTLFRFPIRINSFKNYVLKFLDNDSRILGSSMIFGDSVSDLNSFNQLQNLGLTRLLSISGFHISYIFHLVNERYQGKKYYKKLRIIELSFVLVFLVLTGFKFAFLRISFDLVLKIILNRKKIFLSRPNYLSLLAMSILLFNPFYLYEYGFIYTFIILFLMSILPEFKSIPRSLNTPLVFSISYILLIPINAYINYEVNLLGMIISLILTPFLVAMVLLCLPLIIIPQYGLILRYPLNFVLSILNKVSSLDFTILTGRPNVIYIFIIYILVVLTIYVYNIKLLKQTKVLLCINIISLCVLFVPRIVYPNRIHFIDVGQGDSTLVQINNKNYLFDTGGNIYTDLAQNALIPYFKRNKIRDIETVFITHRDYDHYGALQSLTENFNVNNVYYNYDVDTFSYSGMNIKNLNQYRLDEEENYDSGVYYLTFKNKKVLIMGDAPLAIEKKIIKDNPELRADVIKVGHHGSSTSSSYDFLKTVNPSIAIISCGFENRYNHPSSKVVENLNALNIKIFRTDLQGTIVFNL